MLDFKIAMLNMLEQQLFNRIDNDFKYEIYARYRDDIEEDIRYYISVICDRDEFNSYKLNQLSYHEYLDIKESLYKNSLDYYNKLKNDLLTKNSVENVK